MENISTIIAQCTPSGSGAIALIRLSGPQAVVVADSIAQLPHNKRLSDQQSHTIHYGFVISPTGEHIDQVLFLLMRAPHTFTGEDTVEITCHNNPFIIKNIIDAACQFGARQASNGEFSRQAVDNGKLDLIQAESINELIQAHTQTALKAALGQVEGTFSSLIIACEKQLIKALAFSEASFEFIDEELGFIDTIRTIIKNVHTMVQKAQRSFDAQQQIKNGIRIALIGSVNAGKSSLFNALLKQERAIVTDIAGTTRDSIEAGCYTQGAHQTFVDTAGLRQTDDVVERKGIERSLEQAALADIIILVYDGSRLLTPQEEAVYESIMSKYSLKVITVRSKSDLPLALHCNEKINSPMIPVATNDEQSIKHLETTIQSKIESLMITGEVPFVLNQRHYNLIMILNKHLQAMNNLLEEPVAYELISYHVQEALATLSELTGKTVSEQGMDAVFREFCVGK